MIYKRATAVQNPNGGYTVDVDGETYYVSDINELAHFLEGEGYEGVRKGGSVDSKGESKGTVRGVSETAH